MLKTYGKIVCLALSTVLVATFAVSCGRSGDGGMSSAVPSIPAETTANLNVVTLKADGYYFNVHTASFPEGEIRGQIRVDPAATGTVTITVPLSGSQEVPPAASAAAGTGTLTVDLATGAAVNISVTFSGLSGTATAAHIHEAAAGENGPVVAVISPGTPVVPAIPGY